MRKSIFLRVPAFFIAGVSLGLFLLAHGVASADDDKCVNTANKKIAKVAKAMSGDIAKCIKDGGNNKLTGTIEECITSDPKGKVKKACGKAEEKINKDCPTPPAVPPIQTDDPNALCQIMIDKELAMIHAIFGTDLDEVVVMKDPDKDEWKCQSAVAKAAGKCQIAKLDTFNACKKDLLKAGDPNDAGAVQDACMGTNGPPNHGIPDVKGKIAKKCGNGLGGTLGKKCAGLDTDALFPPCAGHPVSLAQCIDEKIECEVCRALNALDGLDRNCDEFDNGLPDGSCGGEAACEYTSPPTCGGTCPPGELCVDTGTCVCRAPAPLDHFRLYLAGGPDAPLVTLEDQFQLQDVDLGPVMYFGVPASKNFAPIYDPEVHMTAYAIPEGEFLAMVDIVNQFGPASLIIAPARMLLVPTQKMPGGPVAPIPLVRDHYKCYEVIEFTPPVGPVILIDQFNPDLIVDVGPAYAFCNPVDKNGEGILSPEEHLTCYWTMDPAFPPQSIFVRNQFHEEELLLGEAVLLCVPSIKVAVHLP
jgi:hypothetical protein